MPRSIDSQHRPDTTLQFLKQFQRLLRESNFTMSYKFAMLKALCDMAIELPDGERAISIDALADRFILIYWEQSREFAGADLNHGGGAKTPSRAITLAKEWRAGFGNNFWRMQQSPHIVVARREMRDLIRRDVLWRLQPPGERPFIYRHAPRADHIQLVQGAVAAMRELHMLLSDLIESQWTRWIQRRNPAIVSENTLRDHLFGIHRRQIRRIVPRLLELQDGRSFYSDKELHSHSVHVDHFIPWSVSRHDALGNLVLCTANENIRFSDSLKPAKLRKSWERRNSELAKELASLARVAGLRWDPSATAAVAAWAYRTAS